MHKFNNQLIPITAQQFSVHVFPFPAVRFQPLYSDDKDDEDDDNPINATIKMCNFLLIKLFILTLYMQAVLM